LHAHEFSEIVIITGGMGLHVTGESSQATFGSAQATFGSARVT